MFCMLRKEKYTLLYVSKHSSNREKKVIFLMISNRGKRKTNSEGCEAKSK